MEVIIFGSVLLLIIFLISAVDTYIDSRIDNLAILVLSGTILVTFLFYDFTTSFGVSCHNTPNCVEFMEARAKFLKSLKDD